MRNRYWTKPMAGRIATRVMLAGGVLLAGVACGPKDGTTRYSRIATTTSGDGVEWKPAAPRFVKLPPAGGSWDNYCELKAGEGKLVAGVLFELKSLPAGAGVSRAVLRLRRKQAKGVPQLSFMNINKGLRILRFADGEPLYGILRARMARDKKAMLRAAFNSDTDAQISGLALSEYPVECSLASENYRSTLFSKGQPYHLLLEKWNPARKAGHKLAGAWDEVDVTEAVRAQLSGDKVLLAGIKVTGGSLVWFADGRRQPWAAPQLIVEYSGGTATGAPKPAPKPEAKPAPKPQSEPEPEPRSATGRGKIVIGSEPGRADIYVDGKYVGTTPSRELVFPVGEIKLRIEKKGYEPWERRVTILRDNIVNVAPGLEKK